MKQNSKTTKCHKKYHHCVCGEIMWENTDSRTKYTPLRAFIEWAVYTLNFIGLYEIDDE
jgi:hypothetical protein